MKEHVAWYGIGTYKMVAITSVPEKETECRQILEKLLYAQGRLGE